jgi:hypothetical protein
MPERLISKLMMIENRKGIDNNFTAAGEVLA